MAKRDVDLVIRARDEATKAVKSIASALEEFAGAQKEINQGAGQTRTAIGQLGQSLRQLQQSLGGSAARKIADDINRSRDAVASLGKQIESTTGEAIGFTREYRAAAAATEKLRQEASQVAATIKTQSAALKESAAAQRTLNSEVKRASTDRNKLIQKDRELSDQIERQRLELTLARGALQNIRTQLNATAQPTKRLQNSFESTSNAVARAVEKLNELRTTQGTVRNAISQTDQTLTRTNQKLQEQATTYDRLNASLTQAKDRQAVLNAALNDVAAGQEKLQKAARDSVSDLERQDAALAGSTQELRKLEGALDRTGGALRELGGDARAGVLQAFGQQRTAVRAANAAWAEAQARVKALAADMRGVTAPTTQMTAAFEKAQAVARAAKTDYEAQRAVLLRLRDVLRDTGAGVDVLQAKTTNFGTRLDNLTASIQRAVTTSKQLDQANDELAASANRAAASQGRVVGATRGLGSAMQTGAAGAVTFSGALRQFYGDSRTALSFTQRLRSEILALGAAYLGFFAAFRGVSTVVSAFQTLEAAQNRLGAVFQQNQGLVAREIDFLRREADRLGISFQVLSDQYAKFAVAADTANFSNEAIRETFISVAEAGRVNKLSIEQLNGIFLALQQIISKGKVQSEELRRQLGDRLPGAFQIMASALNVSTAALDDMLKKGEVVADQETLLAFAGELQKRFGSQLPQALQSTTTEIGRFQNSLFEAALTVAQGGFIDAFTTLLRDLNAQFKTADFQAFLQTLSSGLAGLTDILALLVSNWDLLIVAATGFVATKIAPFVVALAGSFGSLGQSSTIAAAKVRAAQAELATMGVQVSRARLHVIRLTSAFRALGASTGIGLLVTGIGLALGAWATRADAATEALVRHEEQVRRVKDAYEAAEGEAAAFAEKVQDISLTQARAVLNDLRDVARESEQAFRDAVPPAGVGSGTAREFVQSVNEAITAFNSGAIPTLAELRARLEEIGEGVENAARLALLDDILTKLGEWEKALGDVGKQQEVIDALKGDMEQAARAADDLSTSTKKTTGDLEKFGEAMSALRESVPEVADELERLEEAASLRDAYQAAVKYAETAEQIAEATRAWNAALDAVASKNLDNVLSGTNRAGSFAERILQIEGVGRGGGTSTAQDLGVRGGFIEETWVRLFEKYFPERAEGMTREALLALRKNEEIVTQMIELLAAENAKILRQAGVAVTDVALQLAHFLGPNGAIKVLQASGGTPLTDLLQPDQIAANQSVLGGGATAEQLIEWSREKLGLTEQELAVQQELRSIEEDRAEEAEKARQKTAETLDDLDFEISQERLIADEKERQAAIEEAVRNARRDNADITEEQLARIREQAGLLYDLQNREKALEAQKKAAADAEQRVNDLLATRTALQERLTLLQETGAPNEQIIATRDGIQAINDQLLIAIERAIAMHEALGGAGADATIAKLKTLKLTIETTGQEAFLDMKKVGELLSGGLVNAFDSFAQSIAQGEKATKALANAFRQFAADFLRQIAMMIAKQAILNALKSISGNPFGIGVGHSGGIAGSLNRTRQVNPMVFYNAMRYHSGGVAGLRPNEVPVIAERGEELVPEEDPRHRNNFSPSAGAREGSGDVRVVNAFDSVSFLEEAMQSTRGENVVLNFIRARPDAVRSALGV